MDLSYYYNLYNRICNVIDFKKIYLRKGRIPPEGVEIEEGPKGGKYWETDKIPTTKTNIPTVGSKVKGITPKPIQSEKDAKIMKEAEERGKAYTEKLEQQKAKKKPKEQKAKKSNDLFEMHEVESSNIAEIGYDEKTSTLYVKFNRGGFYSYEDVTKSVFDEFLNDPVPDKDGKPSYGVHFNRFIKNDYKTNRLTSPPTKIKETGDKEDLKEAMKEESLKEPKEKFNPKREIVK